MAKSKQPVPVSGDEVCALLEEHANQAVFLQPLIRPPFLSAFRVASAQNYGLAVVIARGDIRVIDDGIVHVEMVGELKLSLAIQAGRILVPGDLERSVPVLGPMKQGDRFATERANQDV